MPARRLRGEKKAYRDLCHPLNNEVREKITTKLFDAYDEFIEQKE